MSRWDAADAALARLRRIGGEELVRDMLSIFFEDTPARIAAATEALRAGDAETVADAAHALKSSCAQLGAGEMQRLCEEAELAAGRSELAAVGHLLASLEAELAAFRAWLERSRVAAGPAASP